MIFDQSDYDVRCEWGPEGVLRLAPQSDVVIVVDVLSFSTSVEVACGRGAVVFPYRWKDETAYAFAEEVGALVADGRGRFSLSPSSLLDLPRGSRIVLPSPNGSTISLLAGGTAVIAGCIRNRRAVSEAAANCGARVAVVPAGERWEDGSLRPCVEDLVGAGAIISELPGRLSPEAQLAVAAFEKFSHRLMEGLQGCASGREKVERGEGADVALAAEIDVSDCVPVLELGAFRNIRM